MKDIIDKFKCKIIEETRPKRKQIQFLSGFLDIINYSPIFLLSPFFIFHGFKNAVLNISILIILTLTFSIFRAILDLPESYFKVKKENELIEKKEFEKLRKYYDNKDMYDHSGFSGPYIREIWGKLNTENVKETDLIFVEKEMMKRLNENDFKSFSDAIKKRNITYKHLFRLLKNYNRLIKKTLKEKETNIETIKC